MNHSITAHSYRDDDGGTRCALVRRGRTRLHITFISDAGIEHRSLPLDSERYLKPLPDLITVCDGPNGQYDRVTPYPIARLVKRFAAIGRERGITEAAKAELALARKEGA
jgi:hypothetical protein